MDEQTVRAQAEAFGQALVEGDIERAIRDLSPELQRNPGEVIALLPLPVTDVAVESIEHGGKAENVVLRLAGEGGDSAMILTRWKDRDGEAVIVELSHVSHGSVPAMSSDDASAEPD